MSFIEIKDEYMELLEPQPRREQDSVQEFFRIQSRTFYDHTLLWYSLGLKKQTRHAAPPWLTGDEFRRVRQAEVRNTVVRSTNHGKGAFQIQAIRSNMITEQAGNLKRE